MIDKNIMVWSDLVRSFVSLFAPSIITDRSNNMQFSLQQQNLLHRRRRRTRKTTQLTMLVVFILFLDKRFSSSFAIGERNTFTQNRPFERVKIIRPTFPIVRRRGQGKLLATNVQQINDDNDDDDDNSVLKIRNKFGMSLAIASCYFSVMGAKCALPAVMSLLTDTSVGLTFPVGTDPQLLLSKQLIISALAVALGKLILGPVIDYAGGIISLQIALSALTILMIIMSLCQSFNIFAYCLIIVDFIFSSCWAASINAIHQCFIRNEWGNQIGRVATAARAGNSIAFVLYASVLQFFNNRGMKQFWRPVFLTAAIIQTVPILLLTYFGRTPSNGSSTDDDDDDDDGKSEKKTIHKQHRPSLRESLGTIRRLSTTIEFWMHFINRSVLMIFASFLMFVPTFMNKIFGTESATGAKVGSLYALGCLLSVSTASKRYATLSKRAKLWTVFILMFVGATGSSIAFWGHVASKWTIDLWLGALLFFIWGFSFAIPFYVPGSIYALAKGGQKSSATIADVFDFGGFAGLAVFNGYVASIEQSNPAAWITTYFITTACALTSFVSLSVAILLENR